MRPDEFRIHLQRQPFQPFRLHLTQGMTIEVRHPEMAVVGRSTVTIGLPVDSLPDRVAVISLLHIIWLEVPVLK